jgi:hypothetical protein
MDYYFPSIKIELDLKPMPTLDSEIVDSLKEKLKDAIMDAHGLPKVVLFGNGGMINKETLSDLRIEMLSNLCCLEDKTSGLKHYLFTAIEENSKRGIEDRQDYFKQLLLECKTMRAADYPKLFPLYFSVKDKIRHNRAKCHEARKRRNIKCN